MDTVTVMVTATARLPALAPSALPQLALSRLAQVCSHISPCINSESVDANNIALGGHGHGGHHSGGPAPTGSFSFTGDASAAFPEPTGVEAVERRQAGDDTFSFTAGGAQPTGGFGGHGSDPFSAGGAQPTGFGGGFGHGGFSAGGAEPTGHGHGSFGHGAFTAGGAFPTGSFGGAEGGAYSGFQTFTKNGGAAPTGAFPTGAFAPSA